jgi:nicotinate-nucleotide pyrophosphorylase (carboxylating)
VEPPTSEEIRLAVQQALAEDIGSGDVTTLATVPADAIARADMVAREPLTVAGLAFAEEAFRQLSPAAAIKRTVQDGAFAPGGDKLLHVSGPARAILSAERVAHFRLQLKAELPTMNSQVHTDDSQ